MRLREIACCATFGLSMGLVGACLKFSAFSCERHEQCDAAAGGQCLAEGSCAYPDADCPGGVRYDEHADPGIAGDCVGGSTSGTGTTLASTGDPTTQDETLTTTASTTTASTIDTETVGTDESSESGDGCGGHGGPCCDDAPSCDDGLACIGDSCGCVTQIEVGERHSCAVLVGGEVYCWGANDLAQLGDSVAPFEPLPIAAIAVVPNDPVREVQAAVHTCVRSEQGNVRCFGDNSSNQVDPALVQATVPPTPAPWIPGANHIAVGASHSCATDGVSMLCWGANGQSQLTGAVAGPGPISYAAGVVGNLFAGGNHNCLLRGGVIDCWGSNSQGQLAQDPMVVPVVETPTTIAITSPIDVALGRAHSCALGLDGAISCWGRNDFGQLGDTTLDPRIAPVAVVWPLEAGMPIEIEAGHHQSCAIDDAGALWCWGSNESGQLMLEPDGMGNDGYTATPVQIDVGATVLAVATGTTHSCVITDGARVLCWGTNTSGQIGDGTTNYAFAPREVMLSCPQ